MSEFKDSILEATEEKVPRWKAALKQKLNSVQESLDEKEAAAANRSTAESADQEFQGEVLTHIAQSLGIIAEGESLTFSSFSADGEELSMELRVFINSIELSLQKQKKLFDSLVDDMKEGEEDLPEKRDWYAQSTDMRLYTFVAKGHYRAWGFLLPPVGEGRLLDESELFNKLEEQRICFGEDMPALMSAVENKHWLCLIPIAQGIEPQNGVDGRIVEHYKRVTNSHTVVTGEENIDYKNLNWLQNVSAGDVICDIIPPTEAVNGRTVYDAEVTASPGRPAKVPMGSHTALNEEQTALIATIDGHVTYSQNLFHIQDSLNIQGNVDNSTGNLVVIGDVVIGGNVSNGFSVCATGNIVVRGLVEGASLKADRDIQVGLGVKGNQKGTLEAKGNIVCKYIESSNVIAGGDVYSEIIVNSTVQCGGDTVVTSGRGVIIGGVINAKKSVRAKILGNELNRATCVNAGVELPTAITLTQLKEQITALTSTCDEIQEKVNFLKNLNSSEPAFQQKLQQLTLQLSVKKMAKVKMEKQLEARIEEQEKNHAQITANSVYPSTIVSISGRRKKITSLQKGCRYYLENGEITG